MKKLDFNKLRQYLPFAFMLMALLCSTMAIADVGNQNRFLGGDSGFDGGDSDLGALLWLIYICFRYPVLIPVVIVVIVVLIIVRKKKKKQASDPKFVNQQVQQQANTDFNYDNSAMVAAQIQAIDPAFSSDKFIGFAREVFMTIQAAWTAKDWKPIRPFESETLFNTHKQQLDEYIRLGKTNVVEKIAIKHCSLQSFVQDGDKEVLTVALNAVMRDYVISDATGKVIESDPDRDWYMKYELVFNRKAGLKTDPGKKGNSITNCPNCGAPTEVTSSGQCTYCGSVITNGEHDWVLSDIHSTN
ncbi:MAG: Tim44 domain-containing protein [Bacteroidales bacterium]|nr:Tim44 domain-containing protein [Bacteroidales bacterium]